MLAALFAALAAVLLAIRYNTRRKGTTKVVPAKRERPWWDLMNVSAVTSMRNAIHTDTLPRFFETLYAQTSAATGRRVTTLDLQMPGLIALTTSSPRNVEAMLQSRFKDFGFGAARNGAFAPLVSSGIFASDGELWSHHRSLLRPYFARSQLQDLSAEDGLYENLLNAIQVSSVDGWTELVDMQPLFLKLMMDSTTNMFFGQCADTLIGKQASVNNTFMAAFDRAQYMISERSNLGAFYWLLNPRHFRHDLRIIHDWVDARILDAKTADSERQGSFLHALLRDTRDPTYARYQLLNIALAGRDTTASLLSWMVFYLARYPEEYNNLRSSVVQTFGNTMKTGAITMEKLQNCLPLQDVMRETLRLSPSIPFNSREALRDTTLPEGGGADGKAEVLVPKGALIFISVYILHRDPQIWGADASSFRSSRWNEGYVPGWEYVPFSRGPRACLGQNLALTLAGFYMVRFMQTFDRLQPCDDEPACLRAALSAKSANGVKVKMHFAS